MIVERIVSTHIYLLPVSEIQYINYYTIYYAYPQHLTPFYKKHPVVSIYNKVLLSEKASQIFKTIYSILHAYTSLLP